MPFEQGLISVSIYPLSALKSLIEEQWVLTRASYAEPPLRTMANIHHGPKTNGLNQDYTLDLAPLMFTIQAKTTLAVCSYLCKSA